MEFVVELKNVNKGVKIYFPEKLFTTVPKFYKGDIMIFENFTFIVPKSDYRIFQEKLIKYNVHGDIDFNSFYRSILGSAIDYKINETESSIFISNSTQTGKEFEKLTKIYSNTNITMKSNSPNQNFFYSMLNYNFQKIKINDRKKLQGKILEIIEN